MSRHPRYAAFAAAALSSLMLVSLASGCDETTEHRCTGERCQTAPQDAGHREGSAADTVADTAGSDGPVVDLPPFQPGWFVVWSEDFSGSGVPAPQRWDYEVGCSIRNSEAQYYTRAREENARRDQGNLVIEARAETKDACNYTSASVITKGRAHFLYGRVEVRAQLPTGKGMWPAIWMMPAQSAYGGWPKSGEIDIMENVGFEPDKIYMTVHTEAYNHTKGNAKGSSTTVSAPYASFHTYAVEWHPDRIDWYVDQTKHFTYDRPPGSDWSTWPFDKPFYLLLNVAVGGGWGGRQGIDPGIFPQKMLVDAVTVSTWIDDPGPHKVEVKAGAGGKAEAIPAGPQHRAGTQVTLTAVPDAGHRFVRWSGTEIGVLENPLKHTVTADRTLTALFVKQGEMIDNGDFFVGKSAWSFHTQGGAQATMTVSNGECHVSITDGGTEAWYVQLQQGGLALEQGKTYRLSFDARAAAARSMTVGLGQSASPWTSYGNKVINLSSSSGMQTFTLDVTMSTSDPTARVTFDLGQSSADLYLDNVSLLAL